MSSKSRGHSRGRNGRVHYDRERNLRELAAFPDNIPFYKRIRSHHGSVTNANLKTMDRELPCNKLVLPWSVAQGLAERRPVMLPRLSRGVRV